jgi:hypothetical protein
MKIAQFLATAFVACSFFGNYACGMEKKLPVVFLSNEVIAGNGVDLNSVSSATKIATETLPQAASIIKSHPSWLLYAKSIAQMGIDIAKSPDEKTKGIGNLVHTLNQKLIEGKYGELSQDEQQTIMKFAVIPKPREDIIKLVNTYTKVLPLALATNQDQKEHTLYRSLMQDQKVTIPELMKAGTVTTPFYGAQVPDQNKSFHTVDSKWLVAHGRNPSVNYNATMRQLADNAAHGSEIIFVSNKDEMLNGFKNNASAIKPIKWEDASQLNDLFKDLAQDTSTDLD